MDFEGFGQLRRERDHASALGGFQFRELETAASSLRTGPGMTCAITGAVGVMTTFSAGVRIGTAMAPGQTLELPADR